MSLIGRFGSADSSLSLRQIGSVTLTQGRGDTLLITQFQVPAILLLSADGDSIGMIGRGGAGPGEFSAPFKPHILNDTVWIPDLNASISRFRLDGQFIDRERPRIPALGPNELAPRFVAPLADGTLLFTASAGSVAEARGGAPARALVRVNRQLAVMDTLLLREVRSSSYFLVFPNGSGMTGRHPVESSDLTAVDPQGRWVVLVTQHLDTDSDFGFEASWIAPSGELLASNYISTEPVSSAGLRNAWIDRLSSSGTHTRSEIEQAASDIPFPPFRPAAENAFSDQDGRVWIESPHEAPDSARWYVLGRDQGLLGSFSLPARVTLLAAAREFAWGWTSGPYDEPYVLKFRVQW